MLLGAEPFLAWLGHGPDRCALLTADVQHVRGAKQDAEVVLPAGGTRQQHEAVLPTVGRRTRLSWWWGEERIVERAYPVDVRPEAFAVRIVARAIVRREVQTPVGLEQFLLFSQQRGAFPLQLSVCHSRSLRRPRRRDGRRCGRANRSCAVQDRPGPEDLHFSAVIPMAAHHGVARRGH